MAEMIAISVTQQQEQTTATPLSTI